MSRSPRTSLRSSLARLAITAAAGALVTTVAVAPAVADEDWGAAQGGDLAAAQFAGGGDGGDLDRSQAGQQGLNQGFDQAQGLNQDLGQDLGQGLGLGQDLGQEEGRGQGQGLEQGREQGRDSGQEQGRGQRNARGVVTARRLVLRSAPSGGGRVIRVVRRGQFVPIYCRTRGQAVDGNRIWYLLPDGTWAWGPARYIDVIGPAPRWC
ncbi:SH3 domain-containing protein [Streptomyces sp. NPDC047000]|uniref:SH3 domain-containing protein n=1 Tax=Streptomyces sp. NPDC047000 TaxID=3155474 RepID=UPI0033C52CD7